MKRVLVGLVVAAAATTGAFAVLSMGGTGDRDAAPSPPQATAEIIRGDLTDTVSLSGKIIFSGERVVRGQTAGTVTAVAASGRTLRQGQVLYRVDRKPIVLMYGRLPLYRPLRQGVKDGPDVRQLETALKALGHGEDVTVDDRFSWATARAVRAWQKRAGLPQTGVVNAEQVVFLPSKVRIAKADVAVGDSVSPGRQVFTVTGILASLPLAPEIDRAALIGFPAARERLGFDGHPTTVYERSSEETVEQVRGMLARTVSPERPHEIAVSRPSDALVARAAAAGTFTNLLLGLGAVALLVGGVGVANTMVISVLERRKEIGLRRALGATRGQIRIQFLTESLLLSVLGGVAGLALGTLVTTGYALSRGWPPTVPTWVLAGAFAATLAVGAIAGIYPAVRASRLAPTVALAAS